MPTCAPPWSKLDWQDMPMPDANAGVQVALLQAAGPRQFLAMVLFPQGWQRRYAGHYAVDEEFFVLAGDLHVNGVCWHEQQYGFVPGHTLRSDTHSEGGCIAYARFHDRPRWTRGTPHREPRSGLERIADWRLIAPTACNRTPSARLLHEGNGASTWLLEALPESDMFPHGERMDVLNLATCVHCRGAACSTQSMPVGPVLLHRAGTGDAATVH